MVTTRESRKNLWDDALHIIFLECCIKEVNKRNRLRSHFNRNGWRNLVKNFNTRTGRNYTKLQLKNHWDAIRKDWELWDRLIRRESGIGWNPIQKTIDVSSQWWEDKIKVDPELEKFKNKNLEMYKMYYEPLFHDSVALHDKSMATYELPRAMRRSRDIDETIGEGGEDMADSDYFLADDNTAYKEGDNRVQQKQGETLGIVFPQTSLKESGSQHLSPSHGKKATIQEDQLDTISQESSIESTLTSPSSVSMGECVRMLAELPGVEAGSEFWNEVCLLFLKKVVRLGFAFQPTPEAKLSYLKFVVEKMKDCAPTGIC